MQLPFSPAMQAEFASLADTIRQYSFEQKGKFPPELKPRLTACAVRAIQLNEYGDNFFNQLPRLFIYNRYTMFKLTKRLVYAEHVKMIVERQDQLLEELGKMVNEGMEGAQAEYDRALAVWEEKRERRKREALAAPPEAPSTAHSPASAPIPIPMEEDKKEGEEKEHEDGEEGEKEDKDKPPQKRFRLSEPMKGLIWALVVLNNEIVALSNEKKYVTMFRHPPIPSG
jgi:Ubinuclein conserved middle domain